MRNVGLEVTLRVTRRVLAELEAAEQDAVLQREESRTLYARAAAAAIPLHALAPPPAPGPPPPARRTLDAFARSHLMIRRGLAPVCDLNSASVDEIAKLDGVSLAQAYDLVLWRPYADWLAVEAVPGFDEASVLALQHAGAMLNHSAQSGI